MQVSVEPISNLERKIKVSLPADRFTQEFNKRVKKAAKTAKIDGFRPGKVPEPLIIARYGDGIKGDVLEGLISSSFSEALKQEQLNPASKPHFDTAETFSAGESIEYSATFEVYPLIELVGLEGQTIEKLAAAITSADIAKVIDNLRQQKTAWHEVDRAAKEGDAVTVDFTGTIAGEKLEGGSAENSEIIIGSKRMIPGFEEGLIGTKASDEVKLNLTFPADYHSKEIAAKPVEFIVKIKQVAEGTLPALDDKLAEDFNVKGGVEGLEAEVKKTLEVNLKQVLANRLKSQVLDKLNELNPIEVPKSLVMNETRKMMQQMLNQLRSGQYGGQLPDLNTEVMQEQAQRRVRLGLLLAETMHKHQLKLDMKKVQAEIMRIAASYENPQEILTHYSKNKDQMAELEASVMEEQIVEKLLEQAQVVEKIVSYDEVIQA